MKQVESGEPGARRRFPIITIALMGLAIAFTLVLMFGMIPSPYIPGAGGLRLGGLLILVPPLLGLLGAVAALFYRPIELGARFGWGIISTFTGFAMIWVLFVLGTWLFGP